MQGAETEPEGSIQRYVTEADWRKQRRRWPIMTHRPIALRVRLLLNDFSSKRDFSNDFAERQKFVTQKKGDNHHGRTLL